MARRFPFFQWLAILHWPVDRQPSSKRSKHLAQLAAAAQQPQAVADVTSL
jgi:hypothetical protein